MNAEEIRAEVIAVAAQEVASWESDPNPNSRHFACGEGIANRLAAAGLLPTSVAESGPIPVYSDEETIAYWRPGWRRYMTEPVEVSE